MRSTSSFLRLLMDTRKHWRIYFKCENSDRVCNDDVYMHIYIYRRFPSSEIQPSVKIWCRTVSNGQHMGLISLRNLYKDVAQSHDEIYKMYTQHIL